MTKPAEPARRPPLWPLLTLLTLTSCGTTAIRTAAIAPAATVPVANPACVALHPLSYSKADTDLTIEEIRQQNAAIRKLCPAS